MHGNVCSLWTVYLQKRVLKKQCLSFVELQDKKVKDNPDTKIDKKEKTAEDDGCGNSKLQWMDGVPEDGYWS